MSCIVHIAEATASSGQLMGPPSGRKHGRKDLNIAHKYICNKERLTKVGHALGFEPPEIERCLYDNPRDIWGASSKLLDTWWQGEVGEDDKRWNKLYTALYRILPSDEMSSFDAKIRGDKTGTLS